MCVAIKLSYKHNKKRNTAQQNSTYILYIVHDTMHDSYKYEAYSAECRNVLLDTKYCHCVMGRYECSIHIANHLWDTR